MDTSQVRSVALRRSRGDRSMLRRTVAVGSTGDPKTLGQVILIVARVLRDDLVAAMRYHYFVKLAGERAVPRPLRYLLYRIAGVRLQRSNIAAGLFLGGPPSHLTIGRGTGINVDCFFDCLARVTLGRNVMVGMGVTIVTSDHPVGPDGRPQRQVVGRDVVIEDDAWLGARSVILPGVTVGEGAIISAGAVVTRDCQPFAVYAGVPARLIQRLRTTDEAPEASL
jgi:acetyltransferase-like isoleucine patch superfamily enzyme